MNQILSQPVLLLGFSFSSRSHLFLPSSSRRWMNKLKVFCWRLKTLAWSLPLYKFRRSHRNPFNSLLDHHLISPNKKHYKGYKKLTVVRENCICMHKNACPHNVKGKWMIRWTMVRGERVLIQIPMFGEAVITISSSKQLINLLKRGFV